MSVDDIEGAQPKRVNYIKGKKRANFFDNQQLNEQYNKQKYQLVPNNLKQDTIYNHNDYDRDSLNRNNQSNN